MWEQTYPDAWENCGMEYAREILKNIKNDVVDKTVFVDYIGFAKAYTNPMGISILTN